MRTILGLEPSPGGVFPSLGGLAQASLVADNEEEEGVSITTIAEISEPSLEPCCVHVKASCLITTFMKSPNCHGFDCLLLQTVWFCNLLLRV